MLQNQEIQKEILLKIQEIGGGISTGALGERLGSKELSGVKGGSDIYKMNLQFLFDKLYVKPTHGDGLSIGSGVRITEAGEVWLNSLTESLETKEKQKSQHKRKWVKGDVPIFDNEISMIKLGEETCPIPLASNQYILCKAVFAVPIDTWIEETSVITNFYKGKESRQSFYDAIRAINRRAKKGLGVKELLKYKASKVKVNLIS